MTAAPPLSVGYCNVKGLTDCNLFVRWLEHFVDVTNTSANMSQIMVLEEHHSHKIIAAVEYLRNNGITIIALPPTAQTRCNYWTGHILKSPILRTLQHRIVGWYKIQESASLHDMVALFGKAFLRSATADKAVNGFQICGLWPNQETVFTDDEFVASMVTDEGPLPPTDVHTIAGQSIDAPALSGKLNDVPTVLGQSTPVIVVAGKSVTKSPGSITRTSSCQSVERIIDELPPRPKLSHRRPGTRVAGSAEVLISFPYKVRLVVMAEKKGKRSVK
ncbi:hypothetical protein LSH36_144g05053 [Paralvinella palmiformis]|uniref:DDE-1 domain-containing protein n=1 Tax=Paralvinella palmiformis TaxID=53620 RepID=A0AAD9JWB3_9ANNE|nr:hypothetical protein LSH36_144g05053 [Paralvinella palmiformis]